MKDSSIENIITNYVRIICADLVGGKYQTKELLLFIIQI